MEKVQRRTTKIVQGLKNLDYQTRLEKLNLYSLAQRRIRGHLIEAFKIINGHDNVNSEQFFKKAWTGHLRGNSLKLYKQRATKKCRIEFFSQKVVEDWNKLPDEVVTAPSVESFKKRLDKHWRVGH